MKKLLKTLLYIVLVLILLFVVAAVCLLVFLDPNKFKGQITHLVQEKTGRELVINGNIDRSFFPWLGLRVHDVRMSNAPGFVPQDTFVSIGEADVSVKLLPLLSGKVEVGKLGLRDMQLNLAKNKEGQTNWQDLIKQHATTPSVATATPSSTNNATTTTATHHKPTQFSIEAIDIQNANIAWVDQKNNQNIQLKNLKLSSQNMGINNPFPLNLQFVLRNKSSSPMDFSLDSNVLLNPQQDNYRLGKLRIDFDLFDKSIPKTQLQAESVVFNLKQQTLSIANALISAANLTAKANLEGMQILDKAHVNYNGRIDIAQFSLKDFLKAFGKSINTQDPQALQKAAISANFIGDADSLKLSSIVGHVDDSAIQGNIAIRNFTDKVMTFALIVDHLNLDRYLPAKTTATTAATPATTVAAAANNSATKSSASPNKFAALKQVNIDGSLQVGTLVAAKTQLANVSAHLNIKNAVVTLDPLTTVVYQGMSSGRVIADLRGSVPHLTLDENLSGVQINQLIKTERLTGAANITTHLTMQGEGENDLLRSLNGSTQFNIKNGALLGVDLPYELNRAAAMIKKQPGPSQANTGKTDFNQFSGSGIFTNGVFSNNDLLLQSAQLKITGSGTANLVTKGLNYHLSAMQPDNPILKNNALPILVTGTFSKPIITPDIEAVVRELLKSGVKTRLEERLDQRGGAGAAAGALLNRFLQR